MDEKIRDAVDVLIAKVESKSREVLEMKRAVNYLAREAGIQPPYDITETGETGDSSGMNIRPDQYYGKTPIKAAREYLELRNRAVPVEEIMAALDRGGFDFHSMGWTNPETRLRNLAISMSKNSMIFHRLPNGTYGLVKFYPDVVEEKKQKKTVNPQASETEGVEESKITA